MNQVQYVGEWSFVVKKRFVTNPGLSIGAKMLYIILKSYCSPNGNTSFPSTERLSAQLKITPKTLLKHAKELEAAKYLKREYRKDNGKFAHTIWTIYGSNSMEKEPSVDSTVR